MVNREIYGRNCGLYGSTIPVFIEKSDKNHRKCIKIVSSDEPCLGRVKDQHFIDMLCLQNIALQPTYCATDCSESILVYVLLPVKSSDLT
jgi:hypothetical protein